MMGLTYTIGDLVDVVPAAAITGPRDDWSHAYFAAERAAGRWVTVKFNDRAKARSLAEAARKLDRFDAELRGTVVYLRTVGR